MNDDRKRPREGGQRVDQVTGERERRERRADEERSSLGRRDALGLAVCAGARTGS